MVDELRGVDINSKHNPAIGLSGPLYTTVLPGCNEVASRIPVIITPYPGLPRHKTFISSVHDLCTVSITVPRNNPGTHLVEEHIALPHKGINFITCRLSEMHILRVVAKLI